MSKNAKGIVAVLVVLGIAAVVYTQLKPSKKAKASYLISGNYTTMTLAQLLSMGDDYVNAWYDAAKSSAASFLVNGKSYNIQGGKAIV
jgi:hypothetical protein